jgi:hypothetical protein
MQTYIKEAFLKSEWAVLGATQTKHKFGYKIFKSLCHKGYSVLPINPNYSDVDGVETKSSLSETTGIEVVNVVVAPEIAYQALDGMSESGVQYVWFQPGAFNEAVIQKANDLGLKVIYGYCVLVELGSISQFKQL